MDRSKNGVALRLAESHFLVDPGIIRIYRIEAPGREQDSTEPIKLLEVNEDTTMNGIVPVSFGAHTASGIFFPSVIIDVRPEEFDQIKKGTLPLPEGWRITEEYPRPVAAASGEKESA